jgi:plastocyanin
MVDRSLCRRIASVAIALALLLSGLVALIEVVPARGETVDGSGASSFSITAVSVTSGFSPNTIQNIATGTNVTISFTDADTTAHTFTIWGKQGTVIANPPDVSPAELNKLVYGSGYKPLANLTLANTGTTSGYVDVATPGWYEFMCMEGGHFQSGMYGFIAFGEALPPNLSVTEPNTGPGAAVFIIVGTIVSLVVIAIVLGFVVGRRRGSEFEMPPERLGYPEPTTPGGSAPSEGTPPPAGGAPPT